MAEPAPAEEGRRGRLQLSGRELSARVFLQRARVSALGRRTRQVVLFAALTGALTGLGVAAFESIARGRLSDHLRQAPLAVQVIAPLVGLVLGALALR